MSDWLSVKQAAKESGYSTKQILRWIHSGKIKADKFVTVWRIDRKSLAAYLKAVSKHGGKRGPKPGT